MRLRAVRQSVRAAVHARKQHCRWVPRCVGYFGGKDEVKSIEHTLAKRGASITRKVVRWA